jgi:hypothetical protein
MTGMVQPDVGPSAKYKENSVDDPVSIISILRGTLSFFPSNSCLPYRFYRNDIEVGNISQNL